MTECKTVVTHKEYKVAVFFTFVQYPYGRHESVPLMRHWIRIGVAVACCVLLSGCAFSIWDAKKEPDTKNRSRVNKSLTKPKIAINSKVGPSVRISPEESEAADQEKDEEGSPSGDEDRKSLHTKEQEAETKGGTLTVSSERGSDPINPSFKKHDHAKYKQRIKNKAIDKLNQQREVTHATLCRDTMTDLWTLTLYRKGKGSFSFISYFWDEIDGTWEKGFDSGRIPLKRWRNHLRSSKREKSCTVLKGAHRMSAGGEAPR